MSLSKKRDYSHFPVHAVVGRYYIDGAKRGTGRRETFNFLEFKLRRKVYKSALYLYTPSELGRDEGERNGARKNHKSTFSLFIFIGSRYNQSEAKNKMRNFIKELFLLPLSWQRNYDVCVSILSDALYMCVRFEGSAVALLLADGN